MVLQSSSKKKRDVVVRRRACVLRSFVVSNNTHNTNLTERNFSRFLMSSYCVCVLDWPFLSFDCARSLVFSHKLVRARLVLFSLLNAPPGIRAAHWTRRRCWAFQVLLFVSARRANKHTLANIYSLGGDPKLRCVTRANAFGT